MRRIRRYGDWQTRLSEYIRLNSDVPSEWGVSDCVSWTCGAVESMTGTDPLGELRGTYQTEMDAARTLIALGFSSLEDAIDSVFTGLGLVEVNPRMARRGDVIIAETEDGNAMGFVGLNGTHGLFKYQDSVVSIPMRAWLRAWRVA